MSKLKLYIQAIREAREFRQDNLKCSMFTNATPKGGFIFMKSQRTGYSKIIVFHKTEEATHEQSNQV